MYYIYKMGIILYKMISKLIKPNYQWKIDRKLYWLKSAVKDIYELQFLNFPLKICE